MISFEFFQQFKNNSKKFKTNKLYHSLNTFEEVYINLISDKNLKGCLFKIFKKKIKILNRNINLPIYQNNNPNFFEKIKYSILNKLIFKFFLNVFRRKILNIKPTVIFVGCYFSIKNRINLEFEGKGKFQTLNFPKLVFERKLNLEDRNFF